MIDILTDWRHIGIFAIMSPKKTFPPERPGFGDDGLSFETAGHPSAPNVQTVELGAGGRLVIPASMRSALGIKVGDRLTVRLEGEELRIHTYETAIRRIQEWVRMADPENKHGVDAFIAERRREAARELKELGDD